MYVAPHRQKQQPPAHTLSNRQEFKMFVSQILAQIRSYLRNRETANELSRLSDRELNDLGIRRFEIDSIARGRGHGNQGRASKGL
ncbi:DUF1127 domain-containing protein (plasmid) [Microvirga sp. RSM25]|uniref:DUF1127 domain-containing protein n=1 Tax=Microvirga sp. RSM25 TaxID=3273802 RepID=UPI00384B2F56